MNPIEYNRQLIEIDNMKKARFEQINRKFLALIAAQEYAKVAQTTAPVTTIDTRISPDVIRRRKVQ